jgi:hypothetical protein
MAALVGFIRCGAFQESACLMKLPIFRTIDDYSFRRVPYTHDGRSLNWVAPNNATTGTHDHYCALGPPASKHTTDGPQKSEYSISDES